MIRYTPIIGRIFEEKPLFLPLRVDARRTGGEDVRFTTADGLDAGRHLPAARGPATASGVLVFCHEYLSDRWSYQPYADHLRDLGFDIFTFDFRNHGASESRPGLPAAPVGRPTTRSATSAPPSPTCGSRPDHDPAGFGLFGVSRGGGTALLVAAARARTSGASITDGAFPTRGTMLAYILRWAEIYVAQPVPLAG